MGIFDGLFGKKEDPFEALRQKVEASPNDARLAQDLSNQLAAKGFHARAVHYARLAARAHREAGFAQKSLGVLKNAQGWDPANPELLQDLAEVYLELRQKEDARGTLMKLRDLRMGDKVELSRIDARLTELGPRR
jgi:Flp pilus assembly protein TadD